MIAPDRRLVRRLRSQVRAKVKAHPALRRERKRARVSWQYRHYTWSLLRFLIPVIVVGAMLAGVSVDRVAAMLVFWSVVVLLHRAGQLTTALQDPMALWIFFYQPVGNAAVFQHQWRVVVRSSLWIGIDWLAFAAALAARSPSPALVWSVPIFAVAQWAATLAVAATLARFWPRLPYAAFASVLYVALFVIFQTFEKQIFANYVGPLLHAFEVITPAGWLAQGLKSLSQGNVLALLFPLGIGASAIAVLRWHWLAFRHQFDLERIFEYDPNGRESPDILRWIPAESGDHPAIASNDEPLPVAEPTAPPDLAALKVALGHSLEQPAGLALFQRGMLERFITRSLTPRQRMLADFLQPHGFSWSSGWLIALGLVVLARLLHAVGFSGTPTVIIAFSGVGFFALPLFGSAWLGFSAVDSFQVRIGLSSFFAVGFWETARLLLTTTTLRCLAAFPLLVLAVRFGVNATPLPWSEALGWALRGEIAVLALQPIWVIAAFSKNSNDSSARGWFTTLLAILILFGLILVVTTGVMLFAVDDLRLALIAGGCLLLGTGSTLLFYGWAYNRGIFDLIARPRPT